MDDGRDAEFSRAEDYFSSDGEPTQPKTKREQLASTATEKDPDRVDATVVASGLTGDSLVLEGYREVGHIMAKIASARNITADRVVIVEPESGRKMAAWEDAPAASQYVIINEEDVAIDRGSTWNNLRLHARIGDRATCHRLLGALEATGEEDDWLVPTRTIAEQILQDEISIRDSEWETSVKTLAQLGVSAGGAFLMAASLGYADGVMCLLSAQPVLIGVKGEARDAYLVNHADDNGSTALLEAAVEGHTGTVETLLAAGSNIEHANSGGETALLRAVDWDYTDTVETLLKAGANTEQANLKGDTALLLAAGWKCILNADALAKYRFVAPRRSCTRPCAMVTKLLKAGANIEHVNSKGDTALLLAARRGHSDVVTLLLRAGANAGHANSAGNTALDVAISGGHANVAAKLRKRLEQSNSDDTTTLAAPCVGRNR